MRIQHRSKAGLCNAGSDDIYQLQVTPGEWEAGGSDIGTEGGTGRLLPEFEVLASKGLKVPEEMQQKTTSSARMEPDGPAARACLAIHPEVMAPGRRKRLTLAWLISLRKPE